MFSYEKGDVSFKIAFVDDDKLVSKIKVFLVLMKEAKDEMEEFLSLLSK